MTAEDLPVHVRFVPEPEDTTPFDALLTQFRALADSKRMQGNYLEELVRHFLRLEPLRADQLQDVWLWKDWPGREGRPDTGIDLVAQTKAGELLAVQVKFFAASHRMQKSDLDSFFEAVGREPFAGGIVVDTTDGAWSTNAQEALKNRTKPIRRITLDALRHSQVDWSSYDLLDPRTAPGIHERKQLRPHQHDAVGAVMNAFAEHHAERGTMVMACGTGKTFTALKIAERWTREQAGERSLILFAVPSLALLQQSLEEWSREHDPELPFRAFAVGSDSKLGRVANGDLTTVALEDLGAPATTDGATLHRLIGDDDLDVGMTVVFSTYQSIQAVSDAQRLGLPSFDLVICDEAHRTTGVTLADEDSSEFVKIHDPAVIDADHRLYMTATPRIFNADVKNKARSQDAELVSMDDVERFGAVVYRIGFGEAVERELLTDYKVLVLGVSEDQIATSFQQDMAREGHELPLSDVAKLIGCWNGMSKRQAGHLAEGFGEDIAPMRRAVAFARDIKTSKGIAQDFPLLVRSHLQNLMNDDPTDDLGVSARHVDGTMNATERGALLDWLKEDPGAGLSGAPEARVLTNARCLSEGVDVPSLDAVLFLNARKSQVDVVQAVGRVMRRAEGKRCGYIILPIAIPDGVSAEGALSDNERYKVVWQVLQALRSHDERLDAQINQMAITGKAPESIVIEHIDLTRKSSRSDTGHGIGDGDTMPDSDGSTASGSASPAPSVAVPLFGADDWKDAVYAKLVRNVGDRMYWDDWAGDISEIAQKYITLIRAHLGAEGSDRAPFEAFLTALRATVNPEIDESEAIELLAQHLVTMPIFEAMFPDDSFSRANPVSAAMQVVIDSFAENAAFAREREPLEEFYSRITDRIRKLPDFTSKQRLLVTLYDRFFTKAFPKLADRMGIVFTPVEVVDYILRSADDALRAAFGRSLGDRDVKILDPFTGTGTFLTRLLQLGIIPPENLEYKYRHDLFANEIVLLSYYIAAVNIESVFREVSATSNVERAQRDETPDSPIDTAFPGISLTDTFAMDERDNQLAGGVFPENTERLERERNSPINVIVMNPPYSVGQRSANDNNQNAKYGLDERIRETYAAKSTATNKNGLYDSYYRALRWATDRIKDRGIIAFVSNSGFVDGNTADGIRLTWAEEFSDIFVFNLRGNARTQGDVRRREAGNVFGEGSRTGVAVAILVKSPEHEGPARVHYADIGDYLSREEKLERVRDEASLRGTDYIELVPNEDGDWINQRDDRFASFTAITGADGIFELASNGVKTNRDAWCYSFSRPALETHVRRLIRNSNAVSTKTNTFDAEDPTLVNWNRALRRDAERGVTHAWDNNAVRAAVYRPFTREWVYFDRAMNDMIYRLPKLFPTPQHPNIAIITNSDSRRAAEPLITDLLPDLHVNGDTQCFARYTWEPITASDGGFNFTSFDESNEDVILDGYRRVDNITDHTLETYRIVYADDKITKDDIFYGVYGLLHHPEYRERYAADLKKMLPRIPHVTGFREYARIGRALADLHIDYESAPLFELTEVWAIDPPEDEFERYAIEKMSWTKRTEHTAIKVNAHLTLSGIPEQANAYTIGGRSPLEWILDRYRIKVDKPSGIVNDPNAWLREHDDPRYVVNLIGSLVTLSMETQRLVAELPAFEVIR
ncbi:DEAD/DEAH box helicase [Microbacterium panaciterrae]|uniref:DEAD/DEAH box helicase n=1 Tax=Microbacterium panaciterrae TaxID=985759 RepID=A0ABP8PFZ0_9MICO